MISVAIFIELCLMMQINLVLIPSSITGQLYLKAIITITTKKKCQISGPGCGKTIRKCFATDLNSSTSYEHHPVPSELFTSLEQNQGIF